MSVPIRLIWESMVLGLPDLLEEADVVHTTLGLDALSIVLHGGRGRLYSIQPPLRTLNP